MQCHDYNLYSQYTLKYHGIDKRKDYYLTNVYVVIRHTLLQIIFIYKRRSQYTAKMQ